MGRTALSATEIFGTATVVDGDTIEVHGRRIRLHGIDAPESAQLCFTSDQVPWRCGQQAAIALQDQIGRSPVNCHGNGEDRYKRTIAVCFKGDENLNAWMVAQGWAVAYRQYSRDYVALEESASAAGVGIWSSRFVMPWDWRRGERGVDAPQAHDRSARCVIKGNINSRGERVYHLPRDRWYAKTQIDQSRGERWFCSESDARAAGWHRSSQ